VIVYPPDRTPRDTLFHVQTLPRDVAIEGSS